MIDEALGREEICLERIRPFLSIIIVAIALARELSHTPKSSATFLLGFGIRV
jgi:hypothetical protein